MNARACVFISVVVTVGFLASDARAGCPNVCEVRVERSVWTMPPCATVSIEAQNCDCGALIKVDNGCHDLIEPVGFTFDSCQPRHAPNEVMACDAVPPDGRGNFRVRVPESEGTGSKPRTLMLRYQSVVHEIPFTLVVSSYGTGCAIAGDVARPAIVPGNVALMGLFVLLVARWLTRTGRRSAAVSHQEQRPLARAARPLKTASRSARRPT